MQDVDPSDALNVPTGHSVKDVEPAELTKEPGGASRQLDCPDMRVVGAGRAVDDGRGP